MINTIIGYAVGITDGGAQSLKCAPLPLQLKSTDIQVASDLPVLTAAGFNLDGITSALPDSVHNKPIRCAFCHAKASTSVSI